MATPHGTTRHRFVTQARCFASLAIVVSIPAANEARAQIRSVDLGTLGGTRSVAFWVNAGGQVVGFSTTGGDAETHAFLWTATRGMVDLGTLGGTISQAVGVNASGQVVGSSYIAGDATLHALSWTAASGMVDLGTLGGPNSQATAVNANGQVVGSSDTADGFLHAFSWTATGGMVDLGTLGGSFSFASGVNDRGQVVGGSETADGAKHAFSWTPAGGMVDLGTLGGNSSQIAGLGMNTGPNAEGQVVGASTTANAKDDAFLWTAAGGMVDLGTLGGGGSAGFAVNARGQIVGSSGTADRESHAFSWTVASGMVDLGTLGGDISLAVAVNDSGQVAGYSYIVPCCRGGGDPAYHAFSWTATGGMVDLGTLGGNFSWAYSINNNGIVVGWAELADRTQHATLWQLARPPVCSRARPDVPVLWPPNHKLVPIHILGVSQPDNHDAPIRSSGVTARRFAASRASAKNRSTFDSPTRSITQPSDCVKRHTARASLTFNLTKFRYS